ncbi:hypothetical protein [Butyrivibrio sp. VCD2006]|uniref:hypothetical protein n=1 Tax=Butyrivibrio sp. VCD2006 TaxID=1280664 RepID=UPI0003F9B0E3|nr:hypothetical protein [Butyrivibrio sp. VCD2006]
MGNIKELLIYVRNGIALVFSWLVICTVIASLTVGSGAISAVYLVKLFLLGLWAVVSFVVSFKTGWSQKKGFIFSLTLFYLMFIPVEIAMFYYMGIFSTAGSLSSWLIFVGIVLGAYIVSVIVDFLIMRKRAIIFTEKIREFNSK